jgi:hypothetical protein
VQLATLDYLQEKLANAPAARTRIDLTLGRNVPVMIEPAAPATERPAAPPASIPSPAAASAAPHSFFTLPPSH